MPKKTPPAEEDWEKKYAPKVRRIHIMLISTVYVLWLGFLAVMAAQRWLGALQ